MHCLTDTELCVVQGDAKAWLFTFKKTGNVPLDLSDATITFTAKKRKGDTDAQAVILPRQLVIKDAENGLAQLELTHDDTSLELATYWFDVQFENPDFKPLTVKRGTLEITYQITKGLYG